ncbi:MAG: FAD-dependent oxidoreductase [Chloroflexi bacterium]|nr:FAD-dependent oxidoreductase [Chloroflexota bacterium]
MTAQDTARVVVIGAGVAGLTSAALLAQAGYEVTVLEAQTYPGGCAGTFYHKKYRFEAGATVAGGFQPNGPHALIGDLLDIDWPVRVHDPAWVVHLPDRSIALTRDNAGVIDQFPDSAFFWDEQSALADLGWSLSAQGLPWPPTDAAELAQLLKVGVSNLPHDLRMIPFALMTAHQWLALRGLTRDEAFVRFIDAQLLISSQTTSHGANAIYSATALDLARQGVYHVEGGIGGLSDTLVDKVRELGGEVRFRQRVEQIDMKDDKVVGVRTKKGEYYDADFVLANVTPWSLDDLLGEASPHGLQREVEQRNQGWGAFVLHLGLEADKLPPGLPDHHQIITEMRGPLGETRSIFISMSPEWDTSRAPEGRRAVTVTTHTNVQQWWDLLAQDEAAYSARKDAYADQMLTNIERALPGFRSSVDLLMPGTPVTYQFYTDRHLGMVGGFPQTSLFKARGPRTGIANLRLVGDSIFPGQSTAGVSLGALRVAKDVQRHLPLKQRARTAKRVETPESLGV